MKPDEMTVNVDVRGMEPPQPLVVILEALAVLPAGTALRACTDRKPMHLYPLLERRGFIGETAQEPEGGYVTIIRRN